MVAAVPRKELPMDEEAEARQKAKHTGNLVRQHVEERSCVPMCGVQSDVIGG